MERVCNKCRLTKPLLHFSKKKGGKYGRTAVCKGCVAVYREENKSKILVRTKLYREKNKEKISTQKRAYYKENKIRLDAQRKEYRDRESSKEKVRVRTEKNKEKIKEYRKEYYKLNKEKSAADSREYYKKNKANIAAKSREYRDNHKEKLKEKRILDKVRSSSVAKNSSELPSKSSVLFAQLPASDKPEINKNGDITVACKHCQERTTPKTAAIKMRIFAIKTVGAIENNFYCSDYCKGECKLYDFRPSVMIDPDSKLYVHNYDPRELQGPWAKAVKERDQYKCQGCDNPENLPVHAHHINALATTYDAWLTENGITLCEFCHGNAHSSEGCRLQDIKEFTSTCRK